MTPADLNLCIAIAEKDEWEFDGTYWRAPGSRLLEDELPFLTDPAETVRMEKELIKHGCWPSYLPGNKKHVATWWWHHPGHLGNQSAEANSYERATAEAYLAME